MVAFAQPQPSAPPRTSKNAHPAFHVHISGLRYYSPETGRWVSRDPIGERGGVGLYGMCGNSPLCVIDPLGTEPEAGDDPPTTVKCCATDFTVVWKGQFFAGVKDYWWKMNITWVGTELEHCEFGKFLTTDVKIPGLSAAEVKQRFPTTGWPIPVGTMEYDDAPFFSDELDKAWVSLPHEDTPDQEAGRKWLGGEGGSRADPTNFGDPLPTVFKYTWKGQVRDKDSKTVVVEKKFGLTYKNYDLNAANPTPSSEHVAIYDIVNIGGTLGLIIL